MSGANLQYGQVQVEEWIWAMKREGEYPTSLMVNLDTYKVPRNKPAKAADLVANNVALYEELVGDRRIKTWMEILPKGPTKGEIASSSIQRTNQGLQEVGVDKDTVTYFLEGGIRQKENCWVITLYIISDSHISMAPDKGKALYEFITCAYERY